MAKMKKAGILFLSILLLAVSTAAADLGSYPQPFIADGSFNGQILVGNEAPSTDALAATEIAVSLQQLSSKRITAGTEEEFDLLKNSILIGLPCQNSAIASVLGTKACDIGLANGTGWLKLVEKDGQTFLIVTGKTPADTRKAARLLAQSENHAFSGTEVLVTGTLDKPQAGKSEQPVQIKPETPQAGCKADADCLESEYCIGGKCNGLGCPEGTKAQSHDCIAAEKTAEKEKVSEQPTPAKAAESKATVTQAESEAAEKPEPETSEKKPSFFTRILSFFRSLFR